MAERDVRITLEDTAMSAAMKLSEGNPGAITLSVCLYLEKVKI